MFAINTENLKTLKYHIFLKRPLKYIFKDLSIAYSKCGKEH